MSTRALLCVLACAPIVAASVARASITDNLCCDPDVNGGVCTWETGPCIEPSQRIAIDVDDPSAGAAGRFIISRTPPWVGYCFTKGGVDVHEPSICAGIASASPIVAGGSVIIQAKQTFIDPNVYDRFQICNCEAGQDAQSCCTPPSSPPGSAATLPQLWVTGDVVGFGTDWTSPSMVPFIKSDAGLDAGAAPLSAASPLSSPDASAASPPSANTSGPAGGCAVVGDGGASWTAGSVLAGLFALVLRRAGKRLKSAQ
jgi:hypothetical protein